MKGVNTRGIKQGNKCMIMSAVAYNLKKLMKFKTTKVSTIVKAMEIKAKRGLLKFVFNTQAILQYQATKVVNYKLAVYYAE
jgi:hypothetical protein